MNCIEIASLDDPRVAVYRDLIHRKLARRSGRFIAETPWVVQRMLAAGWEAESLLASRRMVERVAAEIAPNCPVYVADETRLRELVGFRFHRGVMACGLRRPDRTLGDCLPLVAERGLVVACSGLVDQSNLGGVLRSAAAFGAKFALLDAACADPFSRQTIHVSMGAALQVPIVERCNLAVELPRLQAAGVRVVAAALTPQSEPLSSIAPRERECLVFGSEGAGLGSELLEVADLAAEIPMSSSVDSLNVAAAASVFLYHFARPDLGKP